jgi:hypothetical protein
MPSGGQSGGEAGAAGAPATAPGVKITSPANVNDPNDGDVLVADKVDVLCKVTPSAEPGARPVDPSTIKIQLTAALTTVTANAVATQNLDEYQANFLLTNIAHGAVSFTCSASDTSRPALSGSDVISNFVDKGPVIVVTAPAPDSFHALKDPLNVDFTVAAAPLATGDTGADVGAVTLHVDGVELSENWAGSGHFIYRAILTNPNLFRSPPTGEVPVSITATNLRQPTPAERINDSFIQVDGTPPVITVTSPKSGAMIGGQTALVFTVKDPDSGVNPAEVAVTINRKTDHFDATNVQRWEWNEATGVFTFYFDKADLTDSLVQATITIDAADNAGNFTTDGSLQRGATLVLYRDDKPPIVDLDPPTIRELKKSGVDWYCSNAFDPLGDAVSQRDVVNNTRYFRALVWDLTNQASQDQPVSYYAGPDPSSVYLYLQDDVTAPFVIDRNGDGLCDDIEPPPANQLEHVQQLIAIPAAGVASYMPEATWGDPDPGSACKAGTDKDPAPGLCARQASSLSRVIRYVGVGGEAAIYGISPDAGGLECTGRYWELGAVVDRDPREGWLCVAARASDTVGNVGVSAPLIVCYDDDNTTYVPDCVDQLRDPTLHTAFDPATVSPPIVCTDGCLPVKFPFRFISDLL